MAESPTVTLENSQMATDKKQAPGAKPFAAQVFAAMVDGAADIAKGMVAAGRAAGATGKAEAEGAIDGMTQTAKALTPDTIGRLVTTAKKTVARKKAPAKQAGAKKAAANKTSAKKIVAKKSVAKKAAAKKSPAKKSVAKKSVPKKSAPKKSAARKASAKKSKR